MKTEKLNTLLATASEEDKIAIQAVLDKRAAATASAEAPAENSPAEPTAEAPTENSPAPAKKSEKLTDDELHALAESCRENMHKKVQVVPFNTVEWVDGYIAGVIEEKRARTVLYTIKAVDGRKLVKAHNSKLLKIFDEKEVVARKVTRARAERPDDEAVAQMLEDSGKNVGKLLTFPNANDVDITARIVSVQADRRTNTVMYKLKGVGDGKLYYKVVTATNITIADEFDEEGQEMNTAYMGRRDAAKARLALTPQDRVIKCEEDLHKLEARLSKLQEEIEAKRAQLAEAKAEAQKFIESQASEDTPDDLA